MYCKHCGTLITDESASFCPKCGSHINETDTSKMSSDAVTANNGLSKALLLICIVTALVAIIMFGYGSTDEYGDFGYWFSYEGGMLIAIFLAVIALITGIIGGFIRKKR